MNKCVFCKIVSGELPCYKIYEDDEFLAFLDIMPGCEGHTLIIPKQHVEWVWDYENLGRYFEVVGKIARHMRQVSGDEVVRSFVFGWDVPHAHIHLRKGKQDEWEHKRISDERLEQIRLKYKMN